MVKTYSKVIGSLLLVALLTTPLFAQSSPINVLNSFIQSIAQSNFAKAWQYMSSDTQARVINDTALRLRQATPQDLAKLSPKERKEYDEMVANPSKLDKKAREIIMRNDGLLNDSLLQQLGASFSFVALQPMDWILLNNNGKIANIGMAGAGDQVFFTLVNQNGNWKLQL